MTIRVASVASLLALFAVRVLIADEPATNTSTVIIGDVGRPVIGRLIAPTWHAEPLSWNGGTARIAMQLEMPARPTPPNSRQMTAGERAAWLEQWQQSDEGKAYDETVRKLNALRRNMTAAVGTDGSFRFEGVPAGTYILSVNLPDTGLAAGTSVTASGRFTVSALDGNSDEPHDLNDVTVLITRTLKAGDEAPDFELPTLDGKTVKLSDLRGKYILLDFWATWCGPCIGETPNLKDIYATFGEDPRFAMIALSHDRNEDAPRSYAEKHNLGWTQTFLSGESKSRITSQYGVRSIPRFFLIAPDGRVAATGMRGKAIKETVAQALQ